LADHVLDDVSDDGDHVPVFHDLAVIGNVTVPGYHERLAWFRDKRHRGNNKLQKLIQRGDLSLDTAAVCRVDRREGSQIENVTGDDDVGAAEEHDAVAVGVCTKLAHHLDRVIVEVHRPDF